MSSKISTIMAKIKEFQSKSKEELIKFLKEKQSRLLEIRFGSVAKKAKDTTEARKIKREIARILTVINQISHAK